MEAAAVAVQGAPEPGKRKWKAVYTIVDNQGRKVFLRLGIAFENSDGSMNVKLNAYPANGTLHVREPFPRGNDDGALDAQKGLI